MIASIFSVRWALVFKVKGGPIFELKLGRGILEFLNELVEVYYKEIIEL